MEQLKKKIDPNRIPRHIAIIMDGNGRWAKQQGQDRLFGHFHGVESVRNIIEGCVEIGVEYLTLYAFSTENWDRPKEEVAGLMALLVENLRKEVPTLHKNNIRLHVIGDTSMMPEEPQAALAEALALTAENTGMNLIIALSYSSRWELVEAMKQMAQDAVDGKLLPHEINQDTISNYLTTSEFPDPELMIRTSGEYRISNFLLYQLAYAELYFTSLCWPEFRKKNLFEAVIDFQGRERRFGKTSDQLQNQTEALSDKL